MGKTITTYLIDGDPQGVRYDSIGNKTCIMYVIPRNRLDILSDADREELRKPAFYILLGEDNNAKPKAYIGQTEDFSRRVKDHNIKKDFWQKALLFISIDKEGLTKTDVAYLEHIAIKEASNTNTYILDENKQTPNKPNIGESRMSTIDEFYEDVKFLTKFIGCNIFNSTTKEQEEERHLFYTSTSARGGANAIGFYGSDGFTVLKGSIVTKHALKDVPSNSWKKFIEEYTEEKDGKYILTSDKLFSSPSTAACMCLGRSSNGWKDWKDSEGKTLDEIYRNQ
ncbi:MAG: GIY-YIG nuclease family protein [Prevotella sp.]|nr:GIY-YIG nuclease family protein [Prevotella sp.]